MILTQQTAPPAAPTSVSASGAPQAAPAASPSANATASTPLAPLTLGAATDAALTANPASVAAQQQLVQAQAKLAQALAGQRLQVSLTSSAGLSNAAVIQPPPNQETFYSAINTLTVPLPIGRKTRLAVSQANRQVAAAQAQLSGARLTLAAQVATAYYDLLRKQALLLITRDTLANAQRQQDEAQKRFRAGDVPELDVTRAGVPVATATASVASAEVAVTIARQTLNAALGKDLDEPTDAAPVAPESLTPAISLPVTLEEARRRAREQSPEVIAAQATVQANEDALRIASLSREPTYELQAGDTGSNDKTAFSRLDSIQATIVIPLNDGGLARGQKSEAQAALTQAKAQVEVARRSAEATVSAAYLNAQSSLRQIDATRTVQEIAQTTYDKTLLGYQNGLFPLTDVLNAQSTLTQARIAYTQALYDAALASATLQNTLGNLPK